MCALYMGQQSITKTQFKFSFPKPSEGDILLGLGVSVYLASIGHMLFSILG